MKRPTIVCHMMTSADGRIDCAMTAKLRGVDDYYATLAALEAPSTLSGRVTAQLEMALPGRADPGDPADPAPCHLCPMARGETADGNHRDIHRLADRLHRIAAYFHGVRL